MDPASPERSRSHQTIADVTARVRVALQSLQVASNISGMLVTQFAVFLQALVDDAFQINVQIGIQPDWGNWSTVQNGIENRGATVSSERQLPGRHLI